MNGPDMATIQGPPMTPPAATNEGSSSSTTSATTSSMNNQFEDDEDLFRMELDKMELISGSQRPQIVSVAATNDNQDQEDGKLIDLDGIIMPDGDASQSMIGGADGSGGFSTRDNGVNTNNNESSSNIVANEHDSLADHTKSSRRRLATSSGGGGGGGGGGVGVRPATLSPSPSSSYSSSSLPSNNDQNVILPAPKRSPIDSTRQRIARFVHKIAPELSCYTGLGEHYRGNVSTSSDHRPCLNWLHIQLFRFHQVDNNNHSSSHNEPTLPITTTPLDNHNHCRNPNSDPRGPWCFVPYLEDIDDNNLVHLNWHGMQMKDYSSSKENNSNNNNNRMRIASANLHPKIQFVARSCDIAPCSEYLWLYIVAPPLGLLFLLTCLVAILVRSIRKSHYNSIFSNSIAHQRAGLVSIGINAKSSSSSSSSPSSKSNCKNHAARIGTKGLRRFLMSRGPFAPKKFTCLPENKQANNSNKRPINYLDDIFDIADDIDLSDAGINNNRQHQSSSTSSPKSSESLRLNSSSTFSSSISNHDVISSASSGRQLISSSSNSNFALTNNHCKSINPAFNEKGSQNEPPQLLSRPQQLRTGPMFATLRCQAKPTGTLGRIQQRNNSKRDQEDKSSSFIEQNDQYKRSTKTTDWTNVSSSSSAMNLNQQQSLELKETNCIFAGDLPPLDGSNISIVYDQQPIFEGKFSQVQVAFMKQHQEDSTQATGLIGVQVAVCSLKQQAALADQTIFEANNLRLRNMNHLNILKLIGYIENFNNDHQSDLMISTDEIRHNDGGSSSKQFNQSQEKPKVCALIYDMAHLIDLNDWLKEQNKDSLISDKDQASELSLRQNLTCFAKQIALALDYLHDRNIIYKDLACRNCFIDVTKMLIKLASFNIEFDELDIDLYREQQFNEQNHAHQQQNRLNLKSMIRPKYLLDYYVIDSRPSECQLLPLSWIPLESILFNKFNRQTDVWSFGCLLYELFSLGEVAYFGYSSKQVIDSVRSNLMPPQPLLCPNGIYKLMCKCLSDIPTLRPNVKQIYEQLNLYSGQCSSFLDHHLCSLATAMCNNSQLLKTQHQQQLITTTQISSKGTHSITKTKSFANIGKHSQLLLSSMNDGYDIPNQVGNLQQLSNELVTTTTTTKIPMSKSINLGANKLTNSFKLSTGNGLILNIDDDGNPYDEPIIEIKKT